MISGKTFFIKLNCNVMRVLHDQNIQLEIGCKMWHLEKLN